MTEDQTGYVYSAAREMDPALARAVVARMMALDLPVCAEPIHHGWRVMTTSLHAQALYAVAESSHASL